MSTPSTLANHAESWDLDALGNWDSQSIDGTQTEREHNSQNQLTAVGTSSLAFDNNGNTTADDTAKRFVYDAWNHLTAVTNNQDQPLETNAYDAAGRRAGQNSTAGLAVDLYYSDQWQVLEEQVTTDNGPVTSTQYVWSPVYVDAMVERDDLSHPGTPDAAFGDEGMTSTDAYYSQNQRIDVAGRALAIQDDGKTIVVGVGIGYMYPGGCGVARYNTGGALDTNFGVDGTEYIGLIGPYAVAIQPDDKIVISGEDGLLRLNSDGSMDQGFDYFGYAENYATDKLKWITIQEDGKILISGFDTSGNFIQERCNADGTSDSSFEQTLWPAFWPDFGSQTYPAHRAIAFADDGDVLAGGTVAGAGGRGLFAVVRCDADGYLDSGFGDGGKVAIDLGTGDWNVSALAVDANGQIVVGGYRTGGTDALTLVRLNADGSMDRTFGEDGIMTDTRAKRVEGLAVQDDGNILAVGTSLDSTEMTLSRYLGDWGEWQRLYVLTDANYNTTALVDTTGAVVQRFVEDPYGNVTFLTTNYQLSTNNYSWLYLHQGGRFDENSGLYYFRSRDYSPTLGKWMHEDPAGYVDGASLYGYLGNRVITSVDPSGLVPEDYRDHEYWTGEYKITKGDRGYRVNIGDRVADLDPSSTAPARQSALAPSGTRFWSVPR